MQSSVPGQVVQWCAQQGPFKEASISMHTALCRPLQELPKEGGTWSPKEAVYRLVLPICKVLAHNVQPSYWRTSDERAGQRPAMVGEKLHKTAHQPLTQQTAGLPSVADLHRVGEGLSPTSVACKPSRQGCPESFGRGAAQTQLCQHQNTVHAVPLLTWQKCCRPQY